MPTHTTTENTPHSDPVSSTSLQASPSDTVVESNSELDHPNPFFEPEPAWTGHQDEQQDDRDNDVYSVKSDTAVSPGRGREGEDGAEEERRAVERNARRIPLERKVHWPSERTMQNQFFGGNPKRMEGVEAGSGSGAGPGPTTASMNLKTNSNPTDKPNPNVNRRIKEEARQRKEDSNRARRHARRLVAHTQEPGSAWVVNHGEDEDDDDDGSETALSSAGEDEDGWQGRGRRSSSPFYAKEAYRRSQWGPGGGKSYESRKAWNEREGDVGDLSMDPKTREKQEQGQLRRRPGQGQGRDDGSRANRSRNGGRKKVRNETSEEEEEHADDSEPDSSDEEDGVDRISSGGLSGIFTSLFGKDQKLERENDDDQDRAEKGEKTDGRRAQGRGKRDKAKDFGRKSRDRIKKRRRWSHHALFRRDSMSSLRSGRSSVGSWMGSFDRRRGSETSLKDEKSRGAGVLESEQDARDDAEDMHLATSEDPNDPRVQETGRSKDTDQQNAGEAEAPRETLEAEELYEPHMLTPARTGHSARSSLRSHGVDLETDQQRVRREMKEDLNSPYIPSGRRNKADAVAPNTRLEVAQGWKTMIDRAKAFCRGEDDDVDHTGQYRSFAALIIGTQGLTGVASPELARIAPASGKGAETNKGMRKLSEYSNPRDHYTNTVKEISDDLIHDAQEDGAKMTKKLRARITQKAIQQADAQVGDKPMRGKRRQKEIRISRHPAELVQRQDFIVNLAKALINFGAPTHSVESWLEATSDVLGVQSSFLYLPAVLILAFRDDDARSSDVLLLRPAGALDLYRLSLVHKVYRLVVHDVISVNSGARALRRIIKESRSYHWTVLMTAGFFISTCGSMVAFNGSFVDGLASGAVGLILNGVLIGLLSRHKVMSNIFELTAAGLIAFVARGLGATGYFCYASIVSSAIIIILPGWAICLGALELGSRNVAAGAIRIVFAIVFTLFLSFAISIGTEIMDSIGVMQSMTSPSASDGTLLSSQTVQGSFSSNNTAFDNQFQNGTFTFTNGTSSSSTGQVSCPRNPMYTQWWYNPPPDWSLFLTVPTFAVALAMWFKQDWKSRDMLVSTGVASTGFLVSYWVKPQLPERSDISSAVQAFTVGILGNMYSRIARGSAFPSMVVGILLAVPNAVAAAGGLAQSSDQGQSSGTSQAELSNTVIIAIRMVQTAIGLAIGLFAAAVVIYPFGKRGYIFAF